MLHPHASIIIPRPPLITYLDKMAGNAMLSAIYLITLVPNGPVFQKNSIN